MSANRLNKQFVFTASFQNLTFLGLVVEEHTNI